MRAAGGPGTVLALHGACEIGGRVTAMPGGEACLAAIERVPEAERHLAVHQQHCVGLNAADAAAWDAGAHALLTQVTVSGTRAQVRARLDGLAEHGVTEVVFQPAARTWRASWRPSWRPRRPDRPAAGRGRAAGEEHGPETGCHSGRAVRGSHPSQCLGPGCEG